MIPIHPVLDHFTIALFTIAVLFEIFGWSLNHDTLKTVGYWNLLFAALASLASYLTGLLIAKVEMYPEAAHQQLQLHETLGTISMIFIIALFLWRTAFGVHFIEKLKGVYLAVLIAGILFLFFTGFTGGELVYRYGVGVKPVIEQVTAEKHGYQINQNYQQTTEVEPIQEQDSTQVQEQDSQ